MKRSSDFKKICRNCKNRHMGCQCFCNDYNEFRQLLEKEKKAIAAAKAERAFYYSLKERVYNGK